MHFEETVNVVADSACSIQRTVSVAPTNEALLSIEIITCADKHKSFLAGQWLADEEFEYAGQLTTRKAGASAGRILEAYRKIRACEPSLVDGLEIYSQPAAVVDSVITK